MAMTMLGIEGEPNDEYGMQVRDVDNSELNIYMTPAPSQLETHLHIHGFETPKISILVQRNNTS
ncbi:hypothetical protein TWF173_008680 [Orbilia oligospora]|nr:hypothetical protein TWF173_008680 [Orbilia oligospora]